MSVPHSGNSLSLDLPQALALGLSLCRDGNLAQAEQLYDAILKKTPEQFDALLALGRICIRRQRPRQAVELFERAVAANAEAVDAHIDLAQALGALRRHAEAVAVYRRALALRPKDAAIHTALGLELQMLGQYEAAIEAYRQAIALDPRLPQAHNNLGAALGRLDRVDEGIEHFRTATTLDPNLAEAFDNLAMALRKRGRLEEAVAAYRQAIGARPDRADTYGQLANTLQLLGRPGEAVDEYKRALALAPDAASAYHDLGNALFSLNRNPEALACYERAIELKPDFALAYSNMGLALQQMGRTARGVAAFEKALALAPENIEFHYKMADAKSFPPDDPQLATLERLAERIGSLSDDEQIKLHFILGKAYDDLGRYREAFEHLRHGNALMHRRLPFDRADSRRYFERIRSNFSAEVMRVKSGTGHPSATPVFIIGMPRSGTTLAQQILVGHPRVYAAGELIDLPRAAAANPAEGRPDGYPEMIRSSDRRGLFNLGGAYVAGLPAPLPLPDRVIDKLPGNFCYVGLIHLALPNARIIHLSRDPLDTCFSLYSRLFIAGQPFSYDLEDLGHYYRDYRRLMAHWAEILPAGRMLEVRYEDLVSDLEGEARRMVAYCGLDWDQRCLAFQEAKRAVRTASFSQVRRPLYATSIGRSTPYRDMLRPLIEALSAEP
jgi:tetratricopeptide (TPR) repeat protein